MSKNKDNLPDDIFKSPLESVHNFRDLGATVNSCTHSSLLKTRILYRSARPDGASGHDRDALKSVYNIATVIDLRSHTELIEQAKKFSDNVHTSPLTADGKQTRSIVHLPGMKYNNISLNGSAFQNALAWQLGWISLFKLIGLMATGYRIQALGIIASEVLEPKGLVGLAIDSLKYSTAEIKQIFELMADEQNYPLLLHCTQGKDRTGLVIIIVLLLLEVPLDAIDADYLASEKELESEKGERVRELQTIKLSEAFSKCPDNYVSSVKTNLDEQYGGARKYLESCGVAPRSIDKLIDILKAP